jgi:fructokinase
VKRTGLPAEELPKDHPAWPLLTQTTAEAIAAIAYVLSPARVILGGSVRKAGQLGEEAFFKAVREKLARVLNGYLSAHEQKTEQMDAFVVPPRLGDDAGILGAIALGIERLSQNPSRAPHG